MKSRLVNINDLVINLLRDYCSQFNNELFLLFLQLPILSLGLVVLVVWPLEAYPIPQVIGPQCLWIELCEPVLLSYYHCPLFKTEMAHTFKCLSWDDPINLILIEHSPLPTLMLIIEDNVASLSPSVYNWALTLSLNSCSSVNFGGFNPNFFVLFETPIT